MAIKRQPNPTIMDTQRRLKKLGYDPIWVDGVWGPASESAFQKMYTEMRQQFIAWGTKFTDEELYHLAKMMRDEGFTGGVDSSDMMACIAFETDYLMIDDDIDYPPIPDDKFLHIPNGEMMGGLTMHYFQEIEKRLHLNLLGNKGPRT